MDFLNVRLPDSGYRFGKVQDTQRAAFLKSSNRWWDGETRWQVKERLRVRFRIHEGLALGHGARQSIPARGNVANDIVERRGLRLRPDANHGRLQTQAGSKNNQACDPANDSSQGSTRDGHGQFQKGFNAAGSMPFCVSSTMCSPRRSQLTKWLPARGRPSSGL